MEEFSINNTSWGNSYDYSNISSDYDNNTYHRTNITGDDCSIGHHIAYVVTWIIVCIGLPLTLVAIYALYSLVRKDDQVAPVYVINLLISDLIQLGCMTVSVAVEDCKNVYLVYDLHYIAVMASIGFMVCISLERYLVIAWPLWYRFRRTIKVSVVVCVVVWVLPILLVLPVFFLGGFEVRVFFAVFHLLPFPLLIFFLGGTLKALSAARSVPFDEKRRIVAVLVVVLLIYTLLHLPNIIGVLLGDDRKDILTYLRFILVELSPLADLILYIFMRKGTIIELLPSMCCC